MPIRALIIAIESYPALNEQMAGTLKGTLDTALEFREWLITAKQIQPQHLLFCSEPRLPESTSGATREDIRKAILALRNQDPGVGDTQEFYFFFSGHGYSQMGLGKVPTGNALIAADYQDHINTGDRALSHEEIVRIFRYVLGPGVHYHFVDVCRFARSEDEYPVGSLAVPARPMETGQATVHVLYSTSVGDAARVDSRFGQAMVAGLHGTSRAKQWFAPPPPPRLSVRFQSLCEYIKSRVRGQVPDPNPSDAGPGILLELPHPASPKQCTITVANAQAAHTFELILTDDMGMELQRHTFTGPSFQLSLPPRDYYVQLLMRDGQVMPDGSVPLDLYEDAALAFEVIPSSSLEGLWTFSSSGGLESAWDPHATRSTPVVTTGSLEVRLPSTATGTLRHATTGEVRPLLAGTPQSLPPGHYELQVRDRDGSLIRDSRLEIGPDTTQTVDLTTPASRLHEEIIHAIPHGSHQEGGADFSESLGLVTDQDPALWLAILGASRITQRPHDASDFYKLRDLSLATFTDVPPGRSALYVLTGLEDDVGPLQAGLSIFQKPAEIAWRPITPVPGFHHLSHHAETLTPGTQLISLAFGKVSVMTFATAFLPNRATLITVTQDRHGSIQLHQMLLPLGHLEEQLPARVRHSAFSDGSRLRSVKFIVQSQRAFRRRQEDDPANKISASELEELLYGKWLDPVMAALASYELLRRGRFDHLLEVADNMQTFFPEMPDSAALSRLLASNKALIQQTAARSPSDLERLGRIQAAAALERRGWPLFQDGLAAFEANVENSLPLPAARLDYQNMWTLWRGAVPNPNR